MSKLSDIDLAELYHSYGAAVYGDILKMIPEEVDATRVLKSSFVYIHQHYHLYDPAKCQVFTWILQIARKQIKEFIIHSDPFTDLALDPIKSFRKLLIVLPVYVKHSFIVN